MRRFNLNWFGKQTTNEESSFIFKCIFGIWVFNIILASWANIADRILHAPIFTISAGICVGIIQLGIIILFFNTRGFIRRRYSIPAQYLGSGAGELEDLCCTCCCLCCGSSQMARHTTDYNIYPGAWFSDTGLRDSPEDTFV